MSVSADTPAEGFVLQDGLPEHWEEWRDTVLRDALEILVARATGAT